MTRSITDIFVVYISVFSHSLLMSVINSNNNNDQIDERFVLVGILSSLVIYSTANGDA